MRYFSKLHTMLSVGVITLMSLLPLQAAAQTLTIKPVAKADQSSVVVKLKSTAEVRLENDTFVGSKSQSVDRLNKTLSASKAQRKQALLKENKQQAKQRRAQLQTALPANRGDLDNYYTIKLSGKESASSVANKLKALDVVETAYAKPLPTPAPATSSYSSLQSYFKAAPTGMAINATIGGSATAKQYPGVNGSKVQIADLQYSWNTRHEDLSRLRASGALWANGTPVDPFNNNDHGTAVAGIITADRNGSGIDGIVAGSNYHMVNTYNNERGWDVANAVYTAANRMGAGDIIIVEQQAWTPDGQGFAPIESYQDVYDAIVYATAKGITVVEPAGNGKQSYYQGYDLADAQFKGIFTTARPNSGALIVGGGATGCSNTPARARMPFSNYGSRVDMQAAGECVATTGYSDLYNGSATATYTRSFAGTSSASAIIAGAAAAYSSSYEQTNAVTVSPAQLKRALLTGGSAQNTATNPGKIGALPNMASALQLTDISKPGVATSLTGKSVGSNRISLGWKAASDNLGYVTYEVYRNNIKIATTTGPSFTDTTVRAKTSFSYKVVAVDGSNNKSAASNTVAVTNR